MRQINYVEVGDFYSHWTRCVVLLNNQYVTKAIAADSTGGWVTKYKDDDKGFIEMGDDGLPETITLYGDVLIYDCDNKQEIDQVKREYGG